MNKKGFTLVELLVVIAIIAVLSIIIIPSVISINKNVNNRLYKGKIENVESTASLFASNNKDLFNGRDEVRVRIADLINAGYLTYDVKVGDTDECNATTAVEAPGCFTDPRNNRSLNAYYVLLRKQGAGYIALFLDEGDDDTIINNNDTTLVDAVCTAIANKKLQAQTPAGNPCSCSADRKSIVAENGETGATACIISGSNPNNYLKYGTSDSAPNWRVLGVYKLNGVDGLSAKMITSQPV